MEPLKNPIEIPSQPSELPSVEVPKSIETEKPVSQAQVQAEVARNDDPLAAETAALKPDISKLKLLCPEIAFTSIDDGLRKTISDSQSNL